MWKLAIFIFVSRLEQFGESDIYTPYRRCGQGAFWAFSGFESSNIPEIPWVPRNGILRDFCAISPTRVGNRKSKSLSNTKKKRLYFLRFLLFFGYQYAGNRMDTSGKSIYLSYYLWPFYFFIYLSIYLSIYVLLSFKYLRAKDKKIDRQKKRPIGVCFFLIPYPKSGNPKFNPLSTDAKSMAFTICGLVLELVFWEFSGYRKKMYLIFYLFIYLSIWLYIYIDIYIFIQLSISGLYASARGKKSRQTGESCPFS